MQILPEPTHGDILRALESLLLYWVVHIPSSRKPVLYARKMLVIPIDAQGRENLERVFLELRRKGEVVFRRNELDWTGTENVQVTGTE